MLLELILSAIVLLFTVDYLFKKRRNEVLEASKIIGPKPLPIIGNALHFKDVNTENMMDFAKQDYATFGKTYRLWILHQVTVFTCDIKHIEAILTSQKILEKNSVYDVLTTWLGTGLLLSNGKKWHTRRKIITPTFHFKILEQFVEVFDQQSTVMVKKLHQYADGETAVDIVPIICLMALDIIAESAMGVKVNAQENPEFEYVKALARIAELMTNRVLTPTQRTDWLFRLTAPEKYRQMCADIEIMHKFTHGVIEERREALEKSIKDGSYKPMTTDDTNMSMKKRMALLDVLLQSTVAGSPLSNEDIREEVDTFMFGGHDTTTSAISFCLYLISRHSEVQKKIVEEIQQVIGDDKNQAVSYRDLQELKYLECVIKESLRLYPAIIGVGRKTTEDFVMGDVIIPANTNILISFFRALRDPAHFAEPDSFKPERFDADHSTNINPFAYTPFSAGARNCMGQKFAMLEMKSTISKMLRHYELLPLGPAVRPMINLVLRSKTGVHIGLRPRILA